MAYSVVVKKTVDAAPAKIWETIRGGDGLDKWLPVITQCRLEGSGAGATRYCTMANGAELKEKILEIDDTRRRFRYSIDEHPLPARNLRGTVEVKDAGAERAEVSWSAEFDSEPGAREELEGMFQEIYTGAINGLADFVKKGG
ncbi:MAG: SRPBCC family protein [Burkholderiales bacterium]